MQEAKSPIKYSSPYLNKSINQKKEEMNWKTGELLHPGGSKFLSSIMSGVVTEPSFLPGWGGEQLQSPAPAIYQHGGIAVIQQ